MDDDRTKSNNSHTDAASALGDMLPSSPRGRMLWSVLAVLRLHLVATALAVCGVTGRKAGRGLNWLVATGGSLVRWFESGLETVASIASWDPKMDVSGGVSTAPEEAQRRGQASRQAGMQPGSTGGWPNHSPASNVLAACLAASLLSEPTLQKTSPWKRHRVTHLVMEGEMRPIVA